MELDEAKKSLTILLRVRSAVDAATKSRPSMKTAPSK